MQTEPLRTPRTWFTAAVVAVTTMASTSESVAQVALPKATPSAPSGPSKAAQKPRAEADAVTPAVKDPHRHAKFLERIKQGDIELLFLGDSITDGWPRNGEQTWLNFAAYKPANFGIGGDRTEHLLWRITNGELDGIRPKVAVLMIGTNNIGHFADEKPEWAANGVKKILETIHSKLPETKVLLLGVFPRGTPDSAHRKSVGEINRIIGNFADGQKTRYLDISKSFLDQEGNIPADVMPDKLHPNAKGYEIWYQTMRPVLDEMMR